MRSTDAPERRLIQLLCGTTERRVATRKEVSALLQAVDATRLVTLLKRTGLLVLIGGRALALEGGELRPLERELTSYCESARRWGTATELVSLEILDRLASAGIRALPLKGSVAARELYGDVATRSSRDVDILIAADEISDAIAVLAERGWRWESDTPREDGLPVLHETLVHPTMPRVELHWRVHWYEKQFAADALARARQPGSGAPLEMQPVDGLIALMLFYARDGFAGLRFPADVAAWWDLRCVDTNAPSPTDYVMQLYPALTAPVSVASRLLSDLVGAPAGDGRELPFRWRVAGNLASPFLDAGGQQAEANAGLTDLLLAPPGAAADAMRRVLYKAPHPSPAGAAASRSASIAHVLRVARRWLLGFVPAVVRSYRRQLLAR